MYVNIRCHKTHMQKQVSEICNPPLLGIYNYGKKVKFSLEQAMKAQRGSRGIALLFL
jgi:hypothetical protein